MKSGAEPSVQSAVNMAYADLIRLAASMAQVGCGISDDGGDHRQRRPRGYWLREIQRANDLARARAQLIADIAKRLKP